MNGERHCGATSLLTRGPGIHRRHILTRRRQCRSSSPLPQSIHIPSHDPTATRHLVETLRLATIGLPRTHHQPQLVQDNLAIRRRRQFPVVEDTFGTRIDSSSTRTGSCSCAGVPTSRSSRCREPQDEPHLPRQACRGGLRRHGTVLRLVSLQEAHLWVAGSDCSAPRREATTKVGCPTHATACDHVDESDLPGGSGLHGRTAAFSRSQPTDSPLRRTSSRFCCKALFCRVPHLCLHR